jgi:hypothetical protein
MSNANELEGEELDQAVAEALGGVLDGDGWRFTPPLTIYGHDVSFIKTKHSFCCEWEYGGPIIEREQMKVFPFSVQGWAAQHGWIVRDGSTPLIAAMRAYVASKLRGCASL